MNPFQWNHFRCKANITRVLMVFALLTGMAAPSMAQNWAVSIYGGWMTDAKWEEVLYDDVGYQDAYLAALAIDYTLKHYFNGALTLELEAVVAKYFGDQDHFEFDLPLLAGRWHRFPWQAHLNTTFAFGIGPSYATEVPPVEAAIDGGSDQWMVYWFAEFTFGPPKGFWGLLLRLHHRSEAFGIVADSGGANSVGAGFRFSF